ncbi:MAG: NAD(P)/FAD-dependent oxidoreductase [Ilumatobacter sp.]|uniref:phytoene desaturase family protein n=3 Tax=Ilumatobacter sp. TaxID=1967498 RepID=UPI0032998267
MTTPDFDAVVIGAGHNGLVTAAYLARAGMSTLLVEARDSVGGTASSEQFAGATVNICNCDHLTFRTTPVMEELALADHGLVYQEVEPAQHNTTWDAARTGSAWSSHHDLDATIEEIARVAPGDVDGYRRYAKAAMPAVRMIFEAATTPPTLAGLTKLALARRLAGTPALLRWSRRSASDVLRSYFETEIVRGPGAVTGPMVWGISPEFAGSGLGALTHAMRHVAKVGRPIGGSGQVPQALLTAFLAAGGTLRTSALVTEICCTGDRVSAVRLRSALDVDGESDDDRELVSASIVVSACNPHDTFLRWLKHPPAAADDLIRRWKTVPHADGYESKLDVVLDAVPRLRESERSLGPTTVIAPELASIHRGHGLISQGAVLDEPGLLVNVPTLLDPSMAPDGHHVLSLEALYTPYGLAGGWPGSTEPRRWLEAFADLCEPGLLDSIVDWRAVTPDRYESDFHLPAGHATSFAGGPLAAFRSPHPELTGYETAVAGLYLTGAATFPGAGVWGASGRNCATVVLASR